MRLVAGDLFYLSLAMPINIVLVRVRYRYDGLYTVIRVSLCHSFLAVFNAIFIIGMDGGGETWQTNLSIQVPSKCCMNNLSTNDPNDIVCFPQKIPGQPSLPGRFGYWAWMDESESEEDVSGLWSDQEVEPQSPPSNTSADALIPPHAGKKFNSSCPEVN
jgi:hypothetical protein